MTFAKKINLINSELDLKRKLPKGVEVMNPFQNPYTLELASLFYNKYYSDKNERYLILGINPGRLGAGLTGIPFTDPKKLEDICGIENTLHKKTEPSANFIYDMIEAYGSTELFYNKYLFHSVCPLGFVKDGVNYNYYDNKELEHAVTPYIIEWFDTLVSFNVNREDCFCLGNGKNYKFLAKLNREHKFFKKVIPLPHPRWIVQYRRKKYQEFIQLYLDHL